MWEKLKKLEEEYESLSKKLADPNIVSDSKEFQRIAKAHAELEEIISKYREYKKLLQELEEAKLLAEEDEELRDLAKEEVKTSGKRAFKAGGGD